MFSLKPDGHWFDKMEKNIPFFSGLFPIGARYGKDNQV
jgi:hypothetical protein